MGPSRRDRLVIGSVSLVLAGLIDFVFLYALIKDPFALVVVAPLTVVCLFLAYIFNRTAYVLLRYPDGNNELRLFPAVFYSKSRTRLRKKDFQRFDLPSESFTLDIQQAGYDIDQTDLKGVISYEGFVEEFNDFPWKEQVELEHDGCSPTISVRQSTKQVALWVSAYGSSKGITFMVGLISTFNNASTDTLYTDKKNKVEALFKLYFEGKFDELRHKLGY